MREVTIAVACRLENLGFAGAAARAIAREHLGSEAGALVEIAVTEICSNIIRHAHPGEPDHEFTVALRGADQAIEIEIRDAGPVFSLASREMPATDVPLADLPETGFGIALVHETMDVVEYGREHGVNTIRLVKRTTGRTPGRR